MRRLSSGLRVGQAADDAAGLAVSEQIDANVRSLGVAKRNANDGISLIQTAEGATGEVSNIVKRMRELAVQSSSDTLANTERAYVNDEFTALSSEVDRIASVTEFNGVSLGDGSVATIDVQVGTGGTANDRIQVGLGDLTAVTLGVDTTAIDLSTSAAARTALAAFDTAMTTLNGYRSSYGASQNRLESTVSNLTTYTENLTASMSRIRDADFAAEAANLSKFQIMQQAGLSVIAQANSMNAGVTRLIG